MKNIPKLDGFEYTKVEPLSFDQKSLVLQALGYALADNGLLLRGKVNEGVVETFLSYLNRGEIL